MKIFLFAVCAFYVAVFLPCHWVVADDKTPPKMLYVNVSMETSTYDRLAVSWDVEEPESGIEIYYLSIRQIYEGKNTKLWPTDKNYFVIRPTTTSDLGNAMETKKYLITGLSLKTGGKYFAKMKAMNRAGLISAVKKSAKLFVPHVVS